MALREKRQRMRELNPLMRLAMKYPRAKLNLDVDPRELLAKMLDVSPE